jgi:hydroxymethylglutaryl-CoA lyase
MKRDLPDKVTLIEVGPRDGFQFEKQMIPTEMKVEIINDLVEAGLKHIQVASFVSPARVPQMADAEAVVSRLPESPGVIFSGLVLNPRGLQRAMQAGLKYVEISISASDTHSRKNAGLSFDQAVARMKQMIRLARKENMGLRAGIQCAFGCVYEGDVSQERIVNLVRYYAANKVDAIALSDTTGMANPLSVKRMLQTLMPECGQIPIVLHLHDTRGLGLANLVAALECGVIQFDTAVAGMGGCPFVRGAAGNIATEDTVHLMDSMGISTGVDIAGVSKCSHRLEDYLAKRFPGRMHRLLRPEDLRH